MSENNLEKFLCGYSYRNNPIPLDKEGIFRVLGEDPNSGFAGPHNMPELGIFRGKFRDVAKYAVSLDNFWQWGYGGSITEIVTKEIKPESAEKRKRSIEERESIKEILKKLDEEIGEL
jgi:hypothetical protein